MKFRDYGFDLSTIINDISSGNITGAIGAAVGPAPTTVANQVPYTTTSSSFARLLTPTNIVIGLGALGALIYFSRKRTA